MLVQAGERIRVAAFASTGAGCKRVGACQREDARMHGRSLEKGRQYVRASRQGHLDRARRTHPDTAVPRRS